MNGRELRLQGMNGTDLASATAGATTPAKISNSNGLPARPMSSHKRKRVKRVEAIAADSVVRLHLERINQHIMQAVLYRPFKYEKRLIAIGTYLADSDDRGRGLLTPDALVRCLRELDLGMEHGRDAERLVQGLVGLKARLSSGGVRSGSSRGNSVRYADFIDALRRVQSQADNGSPTSADASSVAEPPPQQHVTGKPRRVSTHENVSPSIDSAASSAAAAAVVETLTATAAKGVLQS
jgi:hypothetical protein